MKFPFFASFIVFCLLVGYEIRKHHKKESKAREEFWQKEAAANSTRRKSLDQLNYIHIPFERLPMDILADDPRVHEYLQQLSELSLSPIVNFTGITNTDLKLQYGAPNIEILSRYDQSYTLLARTLQSWATVLYENNYIAEAKAVLSFAMETNTDISASYKLLASIYVKEGTPEKLQELKESAQKLNSAMKEPILAMLDSIA